MTDENATTWVDRTNYYESLPTAALLVMQLESDRMTNLALNAKLLATEKSAVVGELNMGLDDPDTVAYDKLYDTAYTVHPYKYSTIGTAAEIQGFTVAQANYFYKKYYAASNASILIVGDVVPATVAADVQQYYGAIPMETVTHRHGSGRARANRRETVRSLMRSFSRRACSSVIIFPA